jgi:hypothetical protein
MAGKQKFTVEEIVGAIREGHTPTGAALVLKCNSDTIRNYARRYATVKDALDAEREEIVDYAEMGLRGAVLNKEAWAIAFSLKTLGKSRGYVERQEVTGKDGGAIVVDWDGIDSNQD